MDPNITTGSVGVSSGSATLVTLDPSAKLLGVMAYHATAGRVMRVRFNTAGRWESVFANGAAMMFDRTLEPIVAVEMYVDDASTGMTYALAVTR